MSNGMCWLASAGMRSYNSSSLISGSGTRLTITECPDTDVATFFVFTLALSKIRLMAFATCGASMIAPSTTVSGASDSIPKLTSSYPALVLFNSTDLMELEPISSPTSCLLFFRRITSRSPFVLRPAETFKPLHQLTSFCVHLAHLTFHPSIQNGLTQFPTVAKFECRNLAFRDVTVQGVRADPQILRRLSHIHHFTRFIHEERHSGDADTPELFAFDANPRTAP